VGVNNLKKLAAGLSTFLEKQKRTEENNINKAPNTTVWGLFFIILKEVIWQATL